MTTDIIVSENISGQALEALKAEFSVLVDPGLWKSPDKLLTIITQCRALIVRNQTRVSAALLEAGQRLEVVGRAGTGLDNIDVPAATAAGVAVVSTPDQNSMSAAELTLAMMLALARKLPQANQHVHDGGWERQRFVGTELYGKTLGIVGLGRIGILVALRARAMGMNILAHDAYISGDSVAVTETHARLVDLDELLSTSDFVSCHAPLTAQTAQMFNYQRFAMMKPAAIFLNLARGEVVAENDLVRALQEKRLAGAALDVREQEPPAKSPLCGMENVILTPHIAAFTREAQDRVVTAVCRDVSLVLKGRNAVNFVNFPRPRRLAKDKTELERNLV
jgi:D-3-phosphoglycerate dehydrogenase